MTDTIVRLHPFDGLFFRARHLDLLQDYVRTLSADSTRAGGRGPVYGLNVTLDGPKLAIAPGFAVTGAGRLLVSTQPVPADLPTAPASGSAAWLIEAISVEVEGEPDELTYTRLPGSASSDGGRRSSTKIERLGVRVTAATVPPGVLPGNLRSEVAAARFAAEHPAPGLPGSWSPPPPPSTSDGVPLALLLRTGGGWLIDVWSVRRDRTEPLPEQRRQWSAGLRPASVADAGLRQFQAQLAEQLAAGDELFLSETDAVTLTSIGFQELPPAGFLPLLGGPLRPSALRAPFGGGPAIRVFACDEATARARVEGARHLDRISLRNTAEPRTVDVLVPGSWSTPAADGSVTILPSTSWAVFVRREQVEPEPVPAPEPDEIDLFAVTPKPADYASTIADAKVNAAPADQLVATLDGSAVPGLDAYHQVAAKLAGANRMTMIVAVPDEDDLPLASRRAAQVLSGFGGVAATADRLPGVRIAGLSRPAIRLIAEKP
ncbi:hypothetical protein BJ973_008857 [Actinoplanes tereljensis]|uniref:Uncharacterized protein n=1 Tax=Paractinoplanes tereljensis TaxID=571912 RepID=A0A919NHE2_9ACTN|nr:hypothetical protein [Actinoplanes tereljensis]GIF18180.1 hypothetical protein Ate02nite_09100 [Actinoplanes tereljensis]